MTDGKSKKGAALQTIDPRTLGWWAHCIRVASGWSQETVAELSGLNVRTIQRVEAGYPSSVDTRRALARGLNYDDVDFFNKPENVLRIETIRSELFQDGEELQENSGTSSSQAVRSSMQQKRRAGRLWLTLQKT